MCNEYLKTCFDQYMDLSYNNKLGNKYEPVNLFLVDTYNYNAWFKNEKSTDTTTKGDKVESDMPSVACDEEEVKGRKRLKILTSHKSLTRLPLLFAPIKAGNNSNKLKMKSDKYYIFCVSIIKPLKKFKRI